MFIPLWHGFLRVVAYQNGVHINDTPYGKADKKKRKYQNDHPAGNTQPRVAQFILCARHDNGGFNPIFTQEELPVAKPAIRFQSLQIDKRVPVML